MAEGMLKALLWVLAATAFAMAGAARGQLMPCYFIFGDSTFDNGNNNNLNTSFKANYSPYGIDFKGGRPTGRFTNGRNIPDFIAKLLMFNDSIPPFAGASPEQAHTGINYASGGGGILEETSQHLGERISFKSQIENHRTIINKAAISPEKLKKCLYTINIGSDDYIHNYFRSGPPFKFTYDQYADSLIQLYRSYLKSLYDLGARKVAVFGVSKIGCTPWMIAIGRGPGDYRCFSSVNDMVKPFNKKLEALVNEFNKNYANCKFTFVDVYNSMIHPESMPGAIIRGAVKMHISCCSERFEKELCDTDKQVCASRVQYMYWDNLHFTEGGHRYLANGAFSGTMASPYNIALLATPI